MWINFYTTFKVIISFITNNILQIKYINFYPTFKLIISYITNNVLQIKNKKYLLFDYSLSSKQKRIKENRRKEKKSERH